MSEKTEKSTAKKSKVKILSDKKNKPIEIDAAAAEKVARKAMHDKKITKKAAPTPKEEFVLRWYHLASVVVVLGLVIMACVVLFRRYDLSLIGSERMLRVSYGCTEDASAPSYRYFGVNDGDMFSVGEADIYRTESLDEANLQLITINGKPSIKVKEDGEWKDERIEFGDEKTYVVDSSADCKPGMTVHLSI
jgi:hypothetical protein